MVLEQVMTIFLGTAAGVATVLYTVKPRQVTRYFTDSSLIQIITLPSRASALSEGLSVPSFVVSHASAEPRAGFHGIPSGIFSVAPAPLAAKRASLAPSRSAVVPRTGARPRISGGIRAARKRLSGVGPRV